MKFETIIVTGGIGSGKSRALEAIKAESEVKVDFFSFDDYTKELYTRQDVLDFLQVMFGTTDRSKISNMVFKSARSSGKTQSTNVMLESLNKYFFGLVEAKFLELVNRKAHSTLVIEFPMFFEMKELSNEIKLARSKVKVIAITCDAAVRYQRVQSRDGADAEKIKAIMESQLDQDAKASRSDYIIDTTDGNTDIKVRELIRSKFKKAFYHANP